MADDLMRDILIDIARTHSPICDERICVCVLPGVDPDPGGLFAAWDAEYPLRAAILAAIAYNAEFAMMPPEEQVYPGFEDDLADWVLEQDGIPHGRSVVYHPVCTVDSVITICAAAQMIGHRAVVVQATETVPEPLRRIPRIKMVLSDYGFPNEYMSAFKHNISAIRR